MANILILHPNYPAQFKLHCELLVRHQHNVVFLAQSASERPLDGVKLYVLHGHLGRDVLDQSCSDECQRILMRSDQYREMFQHLSASGYIPDLVISHSGWGCGVAVRKVWPAVRIISYLEWWFDAYSELALYEQRPGLSVIAPEMQHKLQARNGHLQMEAQLADVCVTPTQWQRSQFPASLRSQCLVIHEGVDLDLYAPVGLPDPERRPVLTYGTRGFEQIRGFHYLIEELTRALHKSLSWHVSIVGEDRCFYSPARPTRDYASNGEWAQSRIEAAGLGERVQFRNRLPASEYRSWIRHSSLHVYLSYPFVASWSLVEAMASGALLVVSDVPPVRELLPHGAAIFVDPRRPGWLVRAMGHISSLGPSSLLVRRAARRAALRYDRASSKELWHQLISQLLPT